MNKTEIWEILQTCHLASYEDYDLERLIKENFNPELARLGVQLCSYLQKKELKKSDETKIMRI